MTTINPQWSVTEQGDIICSDTCYEIDHTTLEMDWVSIMSEKNWCNDFYFRQAFEHALKIIEDGRR